MVAVRIAVMAKRAVAIRASNPLSGMGWLISLVGIIPLIKLGDKRIMCFGLAVTNKPAKKVKRAKAVTIAKKTTIARKVSLAGKKAGSREVDVMCNSKGGCAGKVKVGKNGKMTNGEYPESL